MSEETEMDLDNAISEHRANVSAMMERSPLELAKEAMYVAQSPKIVSIRNKVLRGETITSKQYYALAEWCVAGDDPSELGEYDDMGRYPIDSEDL